MPHTVQSVSASFSTLHNQAELLLTINKSTKPLIDQNLKWGVWLAKSFVCTTWGYQTSAQGGHVCGEQGKQDSVYVWGEWNEGETISRLLCKILIQSKKYQQKTTTNCHQCSSCWSYRPVNRIRVSSRYDKEQSIKKSFWKLVNYCNHKRFSSICS